MITINEFYHKPGVVTIKQIIHHWTCVTYYTILMFVYIPGYKYCYTCVMAN